MAASCRIELLGGLRVRRDDHLITRFRTQKTASLLAYLACKPGPQPREVLAELLWPEAAPEAARHSLRTALSSLRRQLEPSGSPGLLGDALLLADHVAIGLRSGVFSCDVTEFEAVLREARQAKNDEDRIALWSQAIELFHNPFLPGFYDDWATCEAERLKDEFCGALRLLMPHLQARGEWSRALHFARRGVALDPLSLETHRDLMRVLDASGAPAAALRHWDELQKLLAHHSMMPDAATRALVHDIERRVQLSSAVPSFITSPMRAVEVTSRATPQVARDQKAIETATTVTLLAALPSQDMDAVQSNAWHQSLRSLSRRYGGRELSLKAVHSASIHHSPSDNGSEVRDEGKAPGWIVAFPGVTAALACAVAVQQKMVRRKSPGLSAALCTGEMKVLAGDHTLDGEYRLDGGAASFPDQTLHRVLALGQNAHDGQILCSEETAALLRPLASEDGTQLIDLGVYHLEASRDDSGAERLFEIRHPSLSQTRFPPPRVPAWHGAALPVPANRFFGREPEITTLRSMLAAERLVTLGGAGGSGKTRLTIELASRLRAERAAPWQGRIFFVPLADLFDARLIADAILGALRMPRLPHLEPLDQIVQELAHPSGRATLLVLDNLEHLVEDGAATIGNLLERARSVTCLVTSRRRLHLRGEREMPLAPLPVRATFENELDALQDDPGVQLFVDRACSAAPDFALTPRNAPSIVALCAALEGVPLAIELAAARACSLSPRRMLELLEPGLDENAHGTMTSFERYDFLRTASRDAPERHRTLRATLDWSYRLLDREAQQFFTSLWVFRGCFSTDAASAVCDVPDAVSLLECLRECSLLIRETGMDDEPCFRTPESIREYAREHAERAGRAESLHRRHATYFLRLAQAGEVAFLQPDARQRLQWIERLQAQNDNVLAAMRWSLEHEPVMALQMACALENFCGAQLTKAGLGAERALENTSGAPSWLVARMLRYASMYAAQRGDCVRQNQLAQQHWELMRDMDDAREKAWALFHLGIAERSLGRYDEACRILDQALGFFRELHDWQCIAWTLLEVGNITVDANDLSAARTIYRECIEAFEHSGDRDGMGSGLAQLADVMFHQGDVLEARRLLDEVASIERELGDDRDHPWRRYQNGKVETALGHFDAAKSYLDLALRGFMKAGSVAGMLCALIAVGTLAAAQEQWIRTIRLLSAETTQRQALGWPFPLQLQSLRDGALEAARAALDEASFAAAWQGGARLTLQEAVDEALQVQQAESGL